VSPFLAHLTRCFTLVPSTKATRSPRGDGEAVPPCGCRVLADASVMGRLLPRTSENTSSTHSVNILSCTTRSSITTIVLSGHRWALCTWRTHLHDDYYHYSAAGAGLPSASASALKIRDAGSAQGMLFGPSVMVGLSSGHSPEKISLLASTTNTASSSGL
jgi:hypothetical protein